MSCPNKTNPLSISKLNNERPINSINYTNQDYHSHFTRLVELSVERYGPNGTERPNTFNDLVEGSLAIMLMEMMSFTGDMLSFKIDQIANEVYIDTVTEPDNGFRLSRLMGFSPTPPIPSKSLWSATLNGVVSSDVVIPTPIGVDLSSDDGPIRIELFAADPDNNPLFDEDIVIPAGSTSNTTIIGLEGTTITNEFTSNGGTLQTYQLNESPVIYDSIIVRVDGQIWDRVDFFTDSRPRHEYRVEFDSSYSAFLMFGNNKNGLSPGPGSTIQVTYRVGGGVRGNITTGYVETQRQVSVPGLTFTVPVTLRNYTRGEYGYDGDTLEDIRRKLPRYLKSQDRAVSADDYKSLAEQFVTPYSGQIGKANAVLRNRGCAANVIDVYVLAKDGVSGLTTASPTLKNSLSDMFKEKQTSHVCVKDGEVIFTDVIVEAIIDKSQRKFESEIRTQIQRRIEAFFNVHDWDFGEDLESSSISKILADVKRVKNFSIHLQTDDNDNSGDTVRADFYQIIRPEQITVSFAIE